MHSVKGIKPTTLSSEIICAHALACTATATYVANRNISLLKYDSK